MVIGTWFKLMLTIAVYRKSLFTEGAEVNWSDDLTMIAAPPCAVLSGCQEEWVLYPGKEHMVLVVKCVSEIRAMSILFSLSVVSSSFL